MELRETRPACGDCRRLSHGNPFDVAVRSWWRRQPCAQSFAKFQLRVVEVNLCGAWPSSQQGLGPSQPSPFAASQWILWICALTRERRSGTVGCVPSKQAPRTHWLRRGMLRSVSAKWSCAILRIGFITFVVGWEVQRRALRFAACGLRLAPGSMASEGRCQPRRNEVQSARSERPGSAWNFRGWRTPF